MTRHTAHRLAFGSASALAITAVLAACSQPASYATVDLSGSYSSNPVAQAYSPITGQPVYTANSLYGPQSFPDIAYVPEAQLAYADAPVDQVASLGYNDAGSYIPQGSYEPAPAYTTPLVTEAPLLSTPEFQTEITQIQPLAQYENVGSLDAPVPQTVPQQEIETVYSVPVFNTPDEPIYQPGEPLASTPSDGFGVPHYDMPTVSDDYATVTPPSSQPKSTIGGWAIEETKLAPLNTQGYNPDGAYVNEAMDIVPPRAEQTRLPAPNALPKLPSVPVGNGSFRVPTASDAYPRPYELLRPGIFPILEGAGEGMVQAPETTPIPLLAFVRQSSDEIETPVQERDLASISTYEIKKGDTLYGIARKLGISVKSLREENGLKADATIYAGKSLNVPVPVAEADETEVSKLEDATPAGQYEYTFDETFPEGDSIGPSIAVIDAETARALDAIERASTSAVETETAEAPNSDRFAWPVHGEVYKLGAGQIEIDPSGNEPVRASAAGRVVHVEDGPLGTLVVIEHDSGWRSLTVGLDEARVSVGDKVIQGKKIGVASREHRVRFELRDAASEVTDALKQLNG